jgi:hypothetical protein
MVDVPPKLSTAVRAVGAGSFGFRGYAFANVQSIALSSVSRAVVEIEPGLRLKLWLGSCRPGLWNGRPCGQLSGPWWPYSQPRSVAIRTACARSTAPSLP